MEKFESMLFIAVVGTWALISVCLVTPYAIKGLNVVVENVSNSSIDVDLTSQYVNTSLCKFIIIATGFTIINMLSDGLILNCISALGNGFTENDLYNSVVVNTVSLLQPVYAVVETIVVDPIKFTSLRESINLDLILLNELKTVTTILNSSTYDLLNTAIMIKAWNHGFFISFEYFKTSVGYFNYYEEFMALARNDSMKFINNQAFLRKLYLMDVLKYNNINYQSYIDICGFENIQQAQAQLVEAMPISCNLGTVSLEELILRNMFGLYLYSCDPMIFDAFFIKSPYFGKWVIFSNFIKFYDFSVVNHITFENDLFTYQYNMDLLLQKSKIMKTVIYLMFNSK